MAKLLSPPALVFGDTIALVAPSEPITKIELRRITQFLEKRGYKVKPGKNILNKQGDYAAGSPEERAKDINEAFLDPEVKAIFTAVGGMVASQILELLDWEKIKANPKIFTGYSDATTLQLAILAKTGLRSFHSPNALSLPDLKEKEYTMTNFWRMMTTPGTGPIKPQSTWLTVRAGTGSGILFGGNLSCLCKLLGTKWDPLVCLDSLFGKETKFLFFWEEDYEQFSEIMRNLWQVRNTGFFERVSGMMVGKLTAVAEKDYKDFPPKKQLILQACDGYDFPIFYGVDFGHEVPKATFPIGLPAKMDTAIGLLEILENA